MRNDLKPQASGFGDARTRVRNSGSENSAPVDSAQPQHPQMTEFVIISCLAMSGYVTTLSKVHYTHFDQGAMAIID